MSYLIDELYNSYIKTSSCYTCNRGKGAYDASNYSTAWSSTLVFESCLSPCLSLDVGYVVSFGVSWTIRVSCYLFFVFFFFNQSPIFNLFHKQLSNSFNSHKLLFFQSMCSYHFLPNSDVHFFSYYNKTLSITTYPSDIQMTKFLPSYGLSQITVKLGVLQRQVVSWIAFGFFSFVIEKFCFLACILFPLLFFCSLHLFPLFFPILAGL